MPAVAVTDQHNLFAFVKLYNKSVAQGVKPIFGADINVTIEESGESTPVTLLCKDKLGFLNLSKLLTKIHLKSNGKITATEEWLMDNSSGLIIIAGGVKSYEWQCIKKGKPDLAIRKIKKWSKCFSGSYYLKVQRIGANEEERYIKEIINIAINLSLPVVATNDVRFFKKSDFHNHEVRVCIQDGDTIANESRKIKYTEEQYLKTQDEMCELFSDIPEAGENSVEISKRCNHSLRLGEYVLPDFPTPDNQPVDEYFRKLSNKEFEKRFENLVKLKGDNFKDKYVEYKARLESEIDVIVTMGFTGYFLIVADFIFWSQTNNVPVGPGRGSGAGSLVAYSLGITNLDPLEYNLLFERFLNPERVSMPDFDIDFCMEGRDRVIAYVADKYGRDNVSQIITYGTMAAKAVIRDVGRAYGHPYFFVDQIAKSVPDVLGIKLKEALDDEDFNKIYNNSEEEKELIDVAMSLEGLSRNAGKHAGGVVIAPIPLINFTPLYLGDGGVVTQLDKDDVESVGLVKFDFLGLRTLTIIKWAVQNIQRKPGFSEFNIDNIELTDSSVFKLLKSSHTDAVFQLESRGMQELIKKLQPVEFEDIISLVALFRPGPLQSGMVDDFIERKHGRAEVDYFHPSLKEILEPTFGVILYQEQVMQIAQILAGYSLGSADILRRAMGKKKPEEMAKQRSVFIDGAINNGVDKDLADRIFLLIEKFSGYGFNKSHSAAYALISYQTAYLKTHHTCDFMAAVLSSDMTNTEKVAHFIDDCNRIGLVIKNPDINTSYHNFSPVDNESMLYGLGAIKGVGKNVIDSIVSERDSSGPYASILDFCLRTVSFKVSKKCISALIKVGAFDELKHNRATSLHNLEKIITCAKQNHSNNVTGQDDMFSNDTGGSLDIVLEIVREWGKPELLSYERKTIGVYLSGHPIEPVKSFLSDITSCQLSDLHQYVPDDDNRYVNSNVTVSGLIISKQIRRTKRGSKMMTITIDDMSGKCNIVLFDESFIPIIDKLDIENVIVVSGAASYDEYNAMHQVSGDKVQTFNEALSESSDELLLTINSDYSGDIHSACNGLLETIANYSGAEFKLKISYFNDGELYEIELNDYWSVSTNLEFISELMSNNIIESVEFI